MDILVAKILAMILMGSLALFFGLLPLKVKKIILKGEEESRERRKRERILSGFLCFGAGVLLATVFIHMIPETREGFNMVRVLRQQGESSARARIGRHYHVHNESINSENLGKSQSSHNDHDHDHMNFMEMHEHSHDHHHGDKIEHEHNHIHHDHDHAHHDHDDIRPVIEHEQTHNDVEHEQNQRNNELTELPNLDNHDMNHMLTNEDNASPTANHSVPHNEYHVKNFKNDIDTHLKELSNDEIDSEGRSTNTEIPSDLSDHNDHNHSDHFVEQTATTISPLDNFEDSSSNASTFSTTSSSNFSNHELAKSEEEMKNKSRLNKRSVDELSSSGSPSSLPSTSALKSENGSEEGKQNDHSGHSHGNEGSSHDYPLAELVVCLGFFIIYFIEEIMHKIFFHSNDDSHNHWGTPSSNGIERGSARRSQHNLCHHGNHIPPMHSSMTTNDEEYFPSKQITSKSRKKSGGNQGAAVLTSMTSRNEWGAQGVDNPVFAGDIEATSWNPKIKESLMSKNQVAPDDNQVGQQNRGTSLPDHQGIDEPDIAVNGTGNKNAFKNSSSDTLSNIRSLLIVVALSFHAVFEGMAIGLQEVEKDVWYLFLAISAHKYVISFCIGLELAITGTSLALIIVYILILALVTPLGIGIGVIITEYNSSTDPDHQFIITILQGLAGGTILYVAIIEVLERERSKRGGRLTKLFCLILGFALMATLESVGGHSHSSSAEPH